MALFFTTNMVRMELSQQRALEDHSRKKLSWFFLAAAQTISGVGMRTPGGTLPRSSAVNVQYPCNSQLQLNLVITFLSNTESECSRSPSHCGAPTYSAHSFSQRLVSCNPNATDTPNTGKVYSRPPVRTDTPAFSPLPFQWSSSKHACASELLHAY